MEGEFLLNSIDIHAGHCTPDTARGRQDGLVGGSLVKQLALLSSDLVALILGASKALHDSSSWPLYSGIATLLMWRVVGQYEVLKQKLAS